MNFRLYDGTVRCGEHMDASSYQGTTGDPCLYCPTGVSLDKATDVHWGTLDEPGFEAERRIARKAQHTPVGTPLHDHREGIRANDMTVLHSALWILAIRGGTVHLAPIPGSVDRNGDIVPLWCAPLG